MFVSPRPLIAALALVGTVLPQAAAAQTAAPAAAAPAPVDARAVVDAVRALVNEKYIIPETGAALDKALAEAQAKGAFAGLSGPALAEAIDATMKTVTPDGHLGVSYDPVRSADIAGVKSDEAGEEELSPAMKRMIALNNGGVQKLEMLPGNIRYMDYTGFMWGTPEAEAAITQAMEFLRGGSALIIDLRHNGGGSAAAVADLTSWFLPAGTPLMKFQTRDGALDTTETKAKPFTLADRPVFVLTAGRTFSAAEEFAAHVSAFDFATLVGENTGGGGFNNSFFPLPGGFLISISTGQAIQLKSGKGWERVGIAPDIAVPQDRALVTAQAEALKKLAVTAPDGEKMAIERIMTVYRAQSEQIAAERPLTDYVGDFGWLKVEVVGDHLVAQTPMGPSELVELGGNEFAPEVQPAMRATFTFADGKATAVEFGTPNGSMLLPRS